MIGLVLCFSLVATTIEGAKFTRPPASVIARRAGATQYAEMFDDGHVHGRHGIHKRLAGSQEDADYEAYQGVLGRAGVDFPVLTGIPNTNFKCRDVGNGYFADLDTDCQVFHICDGGRKISFLCPNGTIFRQNDLICDWWFKVNCALSPSLYAESAEILSRGQAKSNHDPTSNNHLRRSSSRIQLPLPQVITDDVGSAKQNETDEKGARKEPNFKVQQVPTASGGSRPTFKESSGRSRNGGTKLRSRQYASFEYSSQQDASTEGFDFDEFLVPRRRPSYRARVPVRIVHPDYVDSRHVYRGPPVTFRVDADNKESQEFAESASFLKARNTFGGYEYNNPVNRIQFDKVKEEKVRENKSNNELNAFATTNNPQSTSLPNRGTVVYSMTTSTPYAGNDGKYTTQAPLDTRTKNVRYTTARRLESSKTTPFYTPTIPTIASRFENTVTSTSRPITTFFTESSTTRQSTTTTTPVSLEQNPINVSEHALEMMKTLQELEIVTSRPTSATTRDDEEAEGGQRFGLNIPPSSGPDALHSLAVYFANTMENITNQAAAAQNKTAEVTTADADINSAHLSGKTIEGYEKLFQTTVTEPSSTTTSGAPELLARFAEIPDQDNNDLELQQSRNPAYSAAGTPQIRELAQLFTQALSAYLHDPAGFRKVLADIRPKDPSAIETNEILSNRIGRTKDFEKLIAPSSTLIAPVVTTEDLEVLDFSDVTLTTKFGNFVTKSTIETTTGSVSETTIQPEIQKPANTNNKSPDVLKTPASDLIADNQIKTGQFYESDADLATTTFIPSTTTEFDDNNDLAHEINGGLSSMSTIFPYYSEEQENAAKLNKVFSRFQDEAAEVASTISPDISTTPETPEEITTTETSTINSTNEAQTVTISTLLTPPAVKKDSSYSAPTNLILPPRISTTSDDSSEQLQRAQSQSFVTGSKNNFIQITEKDTRKGKLISAETSTPAPELTTVNFEFIQSTTENNHQREALNTTTTPGSPRGHYITKAIPTSLLTTTTSSPTEASTTNQPETTSTYPDTGKISPNPWSSLAYTVFLDPLTINDGLMNSEEAKDNTNAYLPQTTLPYISDSTTESTSTRFGLRSSFNDLVPGNFQSTTEDEVKESMKRKANEMFGQLNETSVNHLMNVMKKADNNKTVRRLILLLIQTCDDDHDKTVEESRKALLDALIGMDNNDIEDNGVQIINGRNGRRINLSSVRNAVSSSTTQEVPITTYRGSNREISRFTAPSVAASVTTTTEIPSTIPPATTTTRIPTTLPPVITTFASRPTVKVLSRFEELLSEETLSTFSDFGKRTTPLFNSIFPSSTAIPAAQITTDLPEEEKLTVYPVYSKNRAITTQEPIFETTTNYRRVPTTTTRPTTTTTATSTTPTTTTTAKPVPTKRTTVRTNRVGKSVETLLGQPSDVVVHTKHSDERALDLLKSLYSLAAKWGRR